LSAAAVAGVLLTAAPTAVAGHQPIPEAEVGGGTEPLPTFIGSPATPDPAFAREPPQHPFLAPNGLSNLHVDGWQTDRNSWFGPLGREMSRTSTFQVADCASHTFDSRGRLITVCVGLEGPRLMMFEPDTLHELARLPLPPRQAQTQGSPNPFTNFSGGGYFVLDQRDRPIIPTTTRHIWVVTATDQGGFEVERDYDLTGVVPVGDAIISALPDWSGRIWFVSVAGVIGTIDQRTGAVASIELGEPISNSFAVDEDGGVYIVSDEAMYRFEARADGTPRPVWRQVYRNDGRQKPGQTQAGSGTTPSIMGDDHVAITDNADPINVAVYERRSGHPVCTAPVFERGASSTDNTLIVTDSSIVVENNFGYTGPASTENGRSTVGGVERVDVEPDGTCRKLWRNDSRAPTSVPKLSLANGLVYVYTKEPRQDRADTWYLTAIDFHSGRTVYKRLAGEGLGFNNNYAPITLAPDGDAYIGVLGGLVRLADAVSPAGTPLRLELALRYRRGPGGCARGPVRASVTGPDRDAVRQADFLLDAQRLARDRQPPFSTLVGSSRLRPGRRHAISASVTTADGRTARPARTVRACPRSSSTQPRRRGEAPGSRTGAPTGDRRGETSELPAATARRAGDELPFTGLAVAALALLGGASTAVGLALRRASRRERGERLRQRIL
jgi:hypothetical protein